MTRRGKILPAQRPYGAAARNEDASFVFASPEGERLLEFMWARWGGISHTKGDPYETAFNEGARSVLVLIESWIAEARGLARKEQHERRTERPEGEEGGGEA